jgi:hypothetical protein
MDEGRLAVRHRVAKDKVAVCHAGSARVGGQ